jgi:hypothetical protein
MGLLYASWASFQKVGICIKISVGPCLQAAFFVLCYLGLANFSGGKYTELNTGCLKKNINDMYRSIFFRNT